MASSHLRPAGWYSRRHSTSTAHLAFHDTIAARRAARPENNPTNRSPREQLDALDFRLGRGQGAVKERLKLYKQLNQGVHKGA